MKCQQCNGTRVISRTVANMQGPSKNQYQSSIHPYVERRFQCEMCKGTGQAPWPTPPVGVPVVLVRLAAKARKEGVQLLHDPVTDAFFATSGTTAGTRYSVTPHSCECKGFSHRGYCKHVAALQAALGWIPGLEDAQAQLQGVA